MENLELSPAFEYLFDYLKRTRGFDFGSYKRASLNRRIMKRMAAVGVEGYDQYMDYLEVHPEEFKSLFNTILINVTGFFRDPQTWEYVHAELIPTIIRNKGPEEPIRVWSAGCASGEEAYTLAMLFADALGLDRFRDRVKIYATDLDDEALSLARQAVYTEREIVGVPDGYRERFFEHTLNRFVFNREIRRSVIFGRHDLLLDAPISRVDLLSCRNTLMYFNAEAQARILDRFHFALNESGVLFLGKAEMLFTHLNLFTPIDLKRRVFAKVNNASVRERLVAIAQFDEDENGHTLINHVRLRDSAFDSDPLAAIVVDSNGVVTLANERARVMFSISTRDLGRPLQDLEISYRPIELRSCIDQVYRDRRTIVMKDIELPSSSAIRRYLDVQFVPLIDTTGAILGTKVIFADVSGFKELQEELQHSKQELETAYEELQSSNEELVTTNEELQSTVEELETTNEELQSTNEELETMNEELQSTNEELQTMNEELRKRGDELNHVNAFLESIFASLRGAVVVVGRDLHVQVWNHRAEDLWGLRPEKVLGMHLLNLDIGLPVDQLKAPIRLCLSGEEASAELVLAATNRRGKQVDCRVTCTPLHTAGGEIRGVIVMMEEVE